MTLLKLQALAAEMIKEGKSNEEIREALFNTKGSRLSQIQAIMKLIE